MINDSYCHNFKKTCNDYDILLLLTLFMSSYLPKLLVESLPLFIRKRQTKALTVDDLLEEF